MIYQATVHDTNTGKFIIQCTVEGHDLRDAETAGITRAVSLSTANPQKIEVRHLHKSAQRQAPQRPHPAN